MNNPLPEQPPENHELAGSAVGPTPAVPDPAVAERLALESKIQSLVQQGRNGANWFYWIAGLSLVNSVILLTGGNTFFFIGLGVTMMADAIATVVGQRSPDIGPLVKGVAF